MFEVGKKYINKCTGSIVECLYLGHKRAFVRTSDGNEYNTPLWNDYYTEYKEPVKHVRYVLWYKRIDCVDCILEYNEEDVNRSKDHINRLGYKLLKTEIIECIEE